MNFLNFDKNSIFNNILRNIKKFLKNFKFKIEFNENHEFLII